MILPIIIIVGKGRNPHTISTTLKTSGQSIDMTETLEEAIQKIHQQDYGAAILDLGDTNASSLRALGNILKADLLLPVIVLTQRMEKNERLEFLANGAYACIPDSCDINTLAAILQRALHFKEHVVKAASLELALKDTEAHFLTMANSTPDAIIQADNQGTIISVNKAAGKMFGYSDDELIGKSLTQIMPIQYRDAHLAGMARLRTTGVAKIVGKTLELRGLRKNGCQFPMELSLSTWHNQGCTYYSGIIRDITQRKEKVARLKAQSEQLRRQAKVLDLVHVMVRNLNDEIIFWNSGATLLYGWTKSQSLGKISHTLLQTIFPMPLELIKKTVMEKGTWEGELIHTKQDSLQLVVASHWELYRNETGEPVGIVEVNNDITKVKHAEKCERIQIDVNFALGSAKNLMEAAPHILKLMGEVGQWDFAYLWRCSHQRIETSRREGLWVNPVGTTPDLCRVVDLATITPFHLTIPELILKTGKPVWLSTEHQEPAAYPATFVERGLQEVLGIPIRNQHTIFGGIVFGCHANHIPSFSYSKTFVSVGFEIAEFVQHQLHDEQITRINKCLLNFGKDVQANINSLVVLCGEFFDATGAIYSHPEGDHLQTIHRWGSIPHVIEPDIDPSPLYFDVIKQGDQTPVVIQDVLNTSYVRFEPWLQAHAIKTLIGQAVMVNGQCIGVLALYFQWDIVPNDCDKQLLSIIAHALAVEEERRTMEQTLQRAYEDTNQLLSSVPGAVLIMNRELRIEYANDIAGEFFSDGQPTIVGENLKAIIPLEQTRWDQLTSALLLVTQKKKAYQGPQEFELHERSYQYRAFSVNLPTSAQSQLGLFIWDMTREKDLQEHLIQSEKLAGLGTLVTGMAHEVNNPAQAILSMGEIIQTGDDPHQISDLAGEIIRYAKHIGSVVQNFASYARPSFQGGLQQININHRLAEAVKLVQLGKKFCNIDVKYEFQLIPLISASQVEIDQAFINLISNAMEAMKGSGVLTLQTHRKDTFIVILISDTGSGIPEKLRGMIFHPFFTTKPPGEGTGLGLSIVHRIITNYRGIIEVESQVGQGTTFTITLPVEAS